MLSRGGFPNWVKKLSHRIPGASPEAQGSCEPPETMLRPLVGQRSERSSVAADLCGPEAWDRAAHRVRQVGGDVARGWCPAVRTRSKLFPL